MALKPLICPNCNGLIETFDSSMGKGFCPFCDAAIVDVQEHQDSFAVNSQGAIKTTEADFDISGGTLKKYYGENPEVIIPSGVSVIGHEAFTGMKGITTVVLPEGIEEIEGVEASDIWCQASLGNRPSGAFSNCTRLKNVVLPRSIKQIGQASFYGCVRLGNVSFPDGIQIGNGAFLGCPIKTLRLPKGFTWNWADGSIRRPFRVLPRSKNALSNSYRNDDEVEDPHAYFEPLANQSVWSEQIERDYSKPSSNLCESLVRQIIFEGEVDINDRLIRDLVGWTELAYAYELIGKSSSSKQGKGWFIGKARHQPEEPDKAKEAISGWFPSVKSK